jgi:hypothetical protein
VTNSIESDVDRLRRLGWIAGIAGPVLLVIYFATPAFTHWPFAGAPAPQLVSYANSHALLFFLSLLWRSQTATTYAGLVTLVGCALLLAVVLVEAVLLEAVPVAAHAGDTATVATTFSLSNGVFVRIFPLGPAPMVFAGIGYALRPAALGNGFGRSARMVAAAFVVAGIVAVFTSVGVILGIVMSVVQAIWILVAAVAVARSARPATSVAAALS